MSSYWIGMCMAIDLIKRNQCHNFIIVEKSSSVGGTWHDNKYPGYVFIVILKLSANT